MVRWRSKVLLRTGQPGNLTYHENSHGAFGIKDRSRVRRVGRAVAMVAMRVPCTNASAMTSRCSVRALVMPDGRPRHTGEEGGGGVARLRLI